MVLKFTLSSHWLKNMKGGDDDDDAGSVSSYASFVRRRARADFTGGEASLSSLAKFPAERAAAGTPAHRQRRRAVVVVVGRGGRLGAAVGGGEGAERGAARGGDRAALGREEAATGKRAEAEGSARSCGRRSTSWRARARRPNA